jgi:uncharacterized membrane protein YhaH (DUF805 family)
MAVRCLQAGMYLDKWSLDVKRLGTAAWSSPRSGHFSVCVVVYVLYCGCDFVLCIVLSVCVILCIVVPLPPDTNPFAANNSNKK